MSQIERYAIFALIDSKSASSIRREQYRLTTTTGNEIALHFPVHVTLKGRYFAEESVVLNTFKEINLTHIKLPFDICLSEPSYIQPELAWLEILPQHQGYGTLRWLHQFFENSMSQVVIEDEVPERFKKSGFRPHVTLSWGVTPEAWKIYYSDRYKHTLKFSKVDSIALVRYSNSWPQEGKIDVVKKY